MTQILIVDDEEIIRKAMTKTFTKYGECTQASSGNEALDSYKKAADSEQPFDLIILDISMEDKDGVEVLKEIRGIEKEKGIEKKNRVKILMATSNRVKKTVKECIKARCDNYLLKPLKPDAVAARLTELGIEAIKDDDS